MKWQQESDGEEAEECKRQSLTGNSLAKATTRHEIRVGQFQRMPSCTQLLDFVNIAFSASV